MSTIFYTCEQNKKWRLISEFKRLILEINPEILTIENVTNLANQPIFKGFVKIFKKEGYFVSYSNVYCPDLGMPCRIAERLVLQTVKGSASFYESADRHPVTLRNQVTSPGGASAEALYYLEKAGFCTAFPAPFGRPINAR